VGSGQWSVRDESSGKPVLTRRPERGKRPQSARYVSVHVGRSGSWIVRRQLQMVLQILILLEKSERSA